LALALLTERQERVVQSWLETAWIRLDDTANEAISRHVRFMHSVARACNAILEGLFGRRIFTLRGVLVSTTLGFALFLLALGFLLSLPGAETLAKKAAEKNISNDALQRVAVLAQAVVSIAGFYLLVFSFLPVMLKPRAVHAWTIFAILFWVCLLGPCVSADSPRYVLSPVSAALGSGAVCAIALIGVFRAIFRYASRTSSSLIAFAIVAGSVLLSLAAVVIPISLLWLIPLSDWSWSFILPALCNTAVVAIAMLPLLIVLTFGMHKLLWPPLNNAMYTLQRYRVVSDQKAAFVYSGFVLMVAGLQGFPDWLVNLRSLMKLATFALGLGVIVLVNSLVRLIGDRGRHGKLLSTSQGAALVDDVLLRFAIDTTDMSSEDRKFLAIQQLEERRHRLRIGL
jgi:MFS family permease